MNNASPNKRNKQKNGGKLTTMQGGMMTNQNLQKIVKGQNSFDPS